MNPRHSHPALTAHQQGAIDRRSRLHAVPAQDRPSLRLLSNGPEEYRTGLDADCLDRILRAVLDTPRFQVIDGGDGGEGGNLHRGTVSEDGIRVTACIRCDGDHFTPWDQIVIDHVARDDSPDQVREPVFTACWMCPATGLDLEHILHGEDDVAEGIESGADLTEAADTAMQFERIIGEGRHPSGRRPVGPDGGSVA